MCDRCDGFSRRFRVEGREYRDLIRQLVELTNRNGIFKMLSGNVALEEILQSQVWPDDLLQHTFRCTNCGRMFELSFNTYHSSTAVWSVMTSEGPASVQ